MDTKNANDAGAQQRIISNIDFSKYDNRAIDRVKHSRERNLALVKENGALLAQIPRAQQTAEMRSAAVAQNGNAIAHVSVDDRTDHLRMMAVTRSHTALLHLVKAEITDDICLAALSHDARAIQCLMSRATHVAMLPKTSKWMLENWDACRNGLGDVRIGQRAWARNFMGALKRHVTQASVHKGPDGAPDTAFIASSPMQAWMPTYPAENNQQEQDREAVEYDGMALSRIPQERHTDILRRAALKSDGRAIRFIAHEHRATDLRCIAVRNTSLALDDLTPEERTDEVWQSVVSSDPWAISKLTPELAATMPITRQFIQKNWYSGLCLRTVVSALGADPQDWVQQFQAAQPMTPEMVDLSKINSVYTSPISRNVPLRNLVYPHKPSVGDETTQEDTFVSGQPGPLHRTPEMKRAAVAQNGFVIAEIPPQERTEDLCVLAVEQVGMAITHLSQPECTDAVCLAAFGSDGNAFWHVSPQHVASLPQTARWIQDNQEHLKTLHVYAHEWMQRFQEALPADVQGQAQDDERPEQHRRERQG